MPFSKSKPANSSPVFEKINLERLKHCAETAESAKQAVATSRKLTKDARELIEKRKKRKAS